MKKCCVITYVFGASYQSYIPYYIYFINQEYPDYDISIYTDRELLNVYEEQLKLLRCSNYTICRIDDKRLGLSDIAREVYNISRGIRWLLYDERLLQYEAIYIGDIDILICKENIGLYEQHVRHAKYLKLPYSNCVRIYKESRSIKHIIGNIKKYGFRLTYDTLLFPKQEWYRLTGLHFMLTKSCYYHIQKGVSIIVEELNKVAENKSRLWNVCNINDESILFELIKASGLDLPPLPSKDGEMAIGLKAFENNNPEAILYRPHHGLHLALWRNKKVNSELALCSSYVGYFKDFINKVNNDDVICNCIYKNDDMASYQIRDMINYYRRAGINYNFTIREF